LGAIRVAMQTDGGQLRFGQMIVNCLGVDLKGDPFYVTDAELADLLLRYVSKSKG
jgi:hypothetical protein